MTALPAPALRLHAEARRLLAARRPAEALPMLDRLAHLPELAPRAAALRAEALAALERLEEAEAAADLALAADPAPQALQLRARIRLARGNRPGALDDAAVAVMARPWDAGAKALLGTALIEAGRLEEAIFFLGEAMAAAPADGWIKARLAQAFMLDGRHAAATELLDHCAATTPDQPGLAALRAQSRLLAGDAAGAEVLAAAALATGAADAGLHSIRAHALIACGRMAEAAPHLTAAARLAPGDGYLAHLAAAAAGEATERASDRYVAALFDGYAPRFEAALLGLGYRVPGLLRRAVERLFPEVASGAARLGPVLDLGCGTGLAGVAIADLLGGPLDGIDLSAGMLREAAGKGLYASLRQVELATALREDTTPRALVLAADVFCYFGALEEVLCLCRACLAPGGRLVFSLERLGEGAPDWRLAPSGRYAHAPGYIRACLAAAGMTILEWREEDLRLEADHAVAGLVIAAGSA